MSRRKKSKKRTNSIFLNPEYEAINEMALKMPDTVRDRTKQKSNGGHQYPMWGSFSGNNYSGGSVHWSQTPSCVHDGSKALFEYTIGGVKKTLYASSTNGLDERQNPPKWGLIIDLAQAVRWPAPPRPSTFIKPRSTARFKELTEFCTDAVEGQDQAPTSEVLHLDWPDMGIPPVTLDFWIRLWEMLPEHTVICCMGGHGRTGTALAALLIASGVTYYDAIDMVRKDHCKKAIETESQEKYLHRIYIDYLTDQQKAGKDVTEALKYAKENPPNRFSSPRKDNGHQGGTYHNSHGPVTPSQIKGSMDENLAKIEIDPVTGIRYKTYLNGDVYTEECVNMTCADPMCDDKSHMKWIKHDMLSKGSVFHD